MSETTVVNSQTDLFFSTENMEVLHQITDEIDSCCAKLEEHDLIET